MNKGKIAPLTRRTSQTCSSSHGKQTADRLVGLAGKSSHDNKQVHPSQAKRAQICRSERISAAEQAGSTGHEVNLTVFISVENSNYKSKD